jgi:quinol monooxygenase YgiN
MVTVGLLVTMTAKPGKEQELATFLRTAVEVARAEPDTAAWFALSLGDMTFGVFDAFTGQAGRQAHLRAAQALAAQAEYLLASPPDVKPVDILAAKL